MPLDTAERARLAGKARRLETTCVGGDARCLVGFLAHQLKRGHGEVVEDYLLDLALRRSRNETRQPPPVVS